MSNDFIIRTEDLRPDKVLDLFVATKRDRELVEILKTTTPLIIEGSRGTGKSFLLRVCEQEQIAAFDKERVFPVYISFVKSALLNSTNDQQFLHWMLVRLCSSILRALQKRGLGLPRAQALNVLTGGEPKGVGLDGKSTRLEQIAEAFENSFKGVKEDIDERTIPTIEDFKNAIQDICEELNVSRFNIFFDEAAHIFRPEQKCQFFTLFRDLRSPYMTCNAAVYPGVTAYGSTFEKAHDGRIEALNRDPTSADYLKHMREIVLKQATSEQQKYIETNGENFDALAYAVTGNPRFLLKIVAKAGRLRSSEVQNVIKDFFREDVWAEHSGLSEKYPGHKELVDWGRLFMENTVIPEVTKRNEERKSDNSTGRNVMMFWLHRDAPPAVKEAIRLLTYTGIVTLYDTGVRGTRSESGSRYLINIGCLAAPSANPIAMIADVKKGITIKRYTEYGVNRSEFSDIVDKVGALVEADMAFNLARFLEKSIDVLELSDHQKTALRSIKIELVKDILRATEDVFQTAKYIGPKRSRKIMNVATAAALEYLSG